MPNTPWYRGPLADDDDRSEHRQRKDDYRAALTLSAQLADARESIQQVVAEVPFLEDLRRNLFEKKWYQRRPFSSMTKYDELFPLDLQEYSEAECVRIVHGYGLVFLATGGDPDTIDRPYGALHNFGMDYMGPWQYDPVVPALGAVSIAEMARRFGMNVMVAIRRSPMADALGRMLSDTPPFPSAFATDPKLLYACAMLLIYAMYRLQTVESQLQNLEMRMQPQNLEMMMRTLQINAVQAIDDSDSDSDSDSESDADSEVGDPVHPIDHQRELIGIAPPPLPPPAAPPPPPAAPAPPPAAPAPVNPHAQVLAQLQAHLRNRVPNPNALAHLP
jgi:hypothetical protein